MMKKRLSKKIWYGSDIDSEGKPVLPPLAKDSEDLEGLHYGELYLHIADDKLSLWTRTLTDQIKQIGGEGSGGELWKLMETESGEKYIFSAFDVATQKDFVSFADGKMLDLPSIYDGLPIDGQTLKWKEVTNEDGSVTRVLESVGGGGGTSGKVTWANIEGKPTWIGESKPSYSWTEITGKPSWIGSLKPTYSWNEIEEKPLWIDGSKLVYKWTSNTGAVNQETVATETWVGNKYLPLTGGTLTGDLRLKDSSNYGMTLYFGDGSFCYISEPSDDKMTIHASGGVTIETGSSYYVEVDSKGIKVNGGIIKYNGSYWEIEGDVLVTGGITSYE